MSSGESTAVRIPGKTYETLRLLLSLAAVSVMWWLFAKAIDLAPWEGGNYWWGIPNQPLWGVTLANATVLGAWGATLVARPTRMSRPVIVASCLSFFFALFGAGMLWIAYQPIHSMFLVFVSHRVFIAGFWFGIDTLITTVEFSAVSILLLIFKFASRVRWGRVDNQFSKPLQSFQFSMREILGLLTMMAVIVGLVRNFALVDYPFDAHYVSGSMMFEMVNVGYIAILFSCFHLAFVGPQHRTIAGAHLAWLAILYWLLVCPTMLHHHNVFTLATARTSQLSVLISYMLVIRRSGLRLVIDGTN